MKKILILLGLLITISSFGDNRKKLQRRGYKVSTKTAVTDSLLYNGADVLTDSTGVSKNSLSTIPETKEIVLEWVEDSIQATEQQAINATFNDSVVGGNVYFDIQDISGHTTFSSGQVKWCAVTIKKKSKIVGLEYYLPETGTFVGKDFNGMALFSIDPTTGIITEELRTANDPNIWKQPVGISRAYFTSKKVLDIGTYYVAISYAASSVDIAPLWAKFDVSDDADLYDRSIYFLNNWNLNFYKAALTDIPTTVDLNDLAGGSYFSANLVIFVKVIGG